MAFLLYCHAFQIKKSITKQQFKNIYLTLNILADITPTKHTLT